MGFSGIGMWEILLILVVALIVLGPGRLPEFARTLGKMVRAIKKASTDLTTTITRELETKESDQASSQSKEGRLETREAPSAVNKAGVESRDNRPTKPGEAPPKK